MADRKEALEKAKQKVHAALEKFGDQIPPKAAPLIEETIAKMEVDHLLPAEALGFSPPIMELMYQQGYNLFQSGKYQDALKIFTILRQLDITEMRYSFAIAASYHYMKDYLDAAANYLIYKSMDPSNPLPSFHLYDCFMKADYPQSALIALEEARILAERDPQAMVLNEKIKLELEHLKEFLKNNYKE